MTETLTYTDLVQALDAARPTVWYGLSAEVEPGQAYWLTTQFPDICFVCHPDDLAELQNLPEVKLRPLRERGVFMTREERTDE